jgi:hypothetical protein
VVVLAAPALGLPAIGLGLLACTGAAGVTWTASLRSSWAPSARGAS